MLILIRGLPGSGKSTLAQTYKNKGYFHFESDQYFMKNGKYKYNPQEISVAHAFCLHNTFSALEQGKNVVVSNTFIKVWEMLPYIKFCEKHCIPFKIIEATKGTGTIHGIPNFVIEKMKQDWEEYEV